MIYWLKWAGEQALRLVLLLIATIVITYILIQLSPIDPVQSYIGADMMRVGPEQRAAIAAYWGWDEPPLIQFGKWSAAFLQGDLGTSTIYRLPVTEVIGERFVSSVALMISSWVIAGIVGFMIGSIAAMQRDKWLDRILRTICYTLASAPLFWVALLMLLVGAVWLGLFPIGLAAPAGVLASNITVWDKIYHMLLPSATLAIAGIAPLALHTRQKMIDILDSDFVLYARAKGERGITLYRRHIWRNALLPALTVQFASFGELFGGAILVEQVFSYPGLGQATIEAALRGDVPLLLGLVIFSTVFVFVGNTMADLLYGLVDPRIRLLRQGGKG
ncbi:ABC transporter permease [Paenibacillus yanchengensis]|uniref:ABC transporter permease n=1 Tax=Paenibacillus yanchengensis TaxID=2035833 RepID=A0ABW4YHD7_9BACL